MRVTVDLGACQGHGVCHMSAPDVFELDETDGHAIVTSDPVPAGLEDAFVVLDGERIAISADATRTVIVDSNRPAYRERDLTLVLAEGSEPVAVNIEAQPKGMLF